MSVTPWRAFVDVCRTGSITVSAEALGFTQSAVSRQLATLEREVGATLLDRHARGVRPTRAGEAALPHARMLVDTLDRALRAVADANELRQCAIGAVPSATMALVPTAMRRLRDKAGIECTLRTGLTSDLVDHVHRGQLDLAVITDAPPGVPTTPAVAVTPITRDRMCVALPIGHRLADQHEINIGELAGARWIEDNPGSESLLRRLVHEQGIDVDIDRAALDLDTKLALVAASLGVALMPGLMATSARPDIAVVALADAPTRGIHAVTRPGRTDLTDVVAALLAVDGAPTDQAATAAPDRTAWRSPTRPRRRHP